MNLNPEQAKGQLTDLLKVRYPGIYTNIIKSIDWDCPEVIKKKIGTKTVFRTDTITLDAAFEIGFAFGGASAKGGYVVFIADYLRTATQSSIKDIDPTNNQIEENQNLNNPVSSITWGVGFRIAICVKSFEAKANLNLSLLSASADLNALDSSFDFMTIGLPEEAIPEAIIRNDGQFKSEQRIALAQWMAIVDKQIIDDEKIGSIEPLMISAQIELARISPQGLAENQKFVYSCFAKNLSLNMALEELKNFNISSKSKDTFITSDLVRDMYYNIYNPRIIDHINIDSILPSSVNINYYKLSEWAQNKLEEQ